MTHVTNTMYSGDANAATIPWNRQPWVQTLFESHTEVLEIAKRKETSGAFGYDFCITVQLQVDEVRHRYLSYDDFNPSRIGVILQTLVEEGPNSYWLEHTPTVELVDKVSRDSFGIMYTVPVDELRRKYLLQEHGDFMHDVFRTFPNIVQIGKRANVVASPDTWMFIRKNTDSVSGVTWMAHPTIERLMVRIKGSKARGRWKLYDGLTGEDALECSHIFTREEVFAAYGQEGSTAALEPSSDVVVAVVAIVKEMVETCSECGCSLKTNLMFGHSQLKEARLCGECELKYEADYGTERTVQESLVFARRKVYLPPPPKQPSKFDPRPGIDDVGLGFSSPSWED